MLENKKKIAVLFLRIFCEYTPGAIMSKTCFHTVVLFCIEPHGGALGKCSDVEGFCLL